MLVTEERALNLWCPFARVGEQASGAAESRPDGSYNCLASGCMQWRWGHDEDGEPAYQRRPLSESHTEHSPLGYCGLAGRPETDPRLEPQS